MACEDCEDGFVIPDRADLVREVAEDAHERARHAGRWETCPDPMCAAMERWVHEESKPMVQVPSPALLDRLVRG